jgi:hypothetical protein
MIGRSGDVGDGGEAERRRGGEAEKKVEVRVMLKIKTLPQYTKKISEL